MGKMNANYGSELHLLRWMGRHRETFNRKVFETTGLRVKEWFEFAFSSGGKSYDVEIKGVSFLPTDIRRKVEAHFPSRWRNSMSWDAVGISEDGTYILIEAKAHAGELKSAKIDRASAEEIKTRLYRLADSLGGDSAAWMGMYYQAANRIFVQHILKEYVKAIQLNVYFCGDRRKGVKCPKMEDEWLPFINEERLALGISTSNAFIKAHVYDLFISVDNA